MNGVTIRPLEEGECYKYLGQDENISLGGPIYKEKSNERIYTSCEKRYGPPKLSGYNKFYCT